jgi:hypothetical protein
MIRPDIGYDKDLGFHHAGGFCKEGFGSNAHQFQYNRMDAGLGGNLQDFFPLQNRRKATASDLPLGPIWKYQTGLGTCGFRQHQHPRISQARGNKPDHTGFSPRSGHTNPERNLVYFPLEQHPFNHQITQKNGNAYPGYKKLFDNSPPDLNQNGKSKYPLQFISNARKIARNTTDGKHPYGSIPFGCGTKPWKGKCFLTTF